MTSTRHSYIQFYPSDWAAGTAGLPPLVEWAYFQICRYNWDKGEALPAGKIPLLLSRDPDYQKSVDLLVGAGMIKQSRSGALSNDRAMVETKRANQAWENKKKAGKIGGKRSHGKAKQKQTLPKQRLNGKQAPTDERLTEPEPEPEPELIELETTVSSPSGDGLEPADICKEWNKVAGRIGRPQIKVLTPERRTLVKARINQYSKNEFFDLFNNVEASPFLRGDTDRWAGVTFDWIMKKGNFQKTIEGNYD